MPQLRNLLQAAGLRSGEYAQLFYARRSALDEVARITSLTGDVPVADRRGFRASVTIVGRDNDGSLKAEVRVTAPNLAGVYLRRVRLVKSQPLT
jgi:hypothetical protein